MNLDPWHVPILVTAGIVLVDLMVWFARRWWRPRALPPWAPTVALGALTLLAMALFVMAFGPSLADQMASIAAAVAGLATLYLTYRSYHTGSDDQPRTRRAEDHPEPVDGSEP